MLTSCPLFVESYIAQTQPTCVSILNCHNPFSLPILQGSRQWRATEGDPLFGQSPDNSEGVEIARLGGGGRSAGARQHDRGGGCRSYDGAAGRRRGEVC